MVSCPSRTPSSAGALGVEDLLHPLQLDEVVRRADGAEAVAGQLPGQAGELGGEPVDAAVAVQVEPAALLDALQVLGRRVPPLDAELGALVGRPDDLGGGQLAATLGGVGVALPDGAHEPLHRALVGDLAVHRDQRHPAVHRRARQVGPHRRGGRDRDARRAAPSWTCGGSRAAPREERPGPRPRPDAPAPPAPGGQLAACWGRRTPTGDGAVEDADGCEAGVAGMRGHLLSLSSRRGRWPAPRARGPAVRWR